MSEKVGHRPEIADTHEDDFVGDGETPAYPDTIPGVLKWSPSVAPSKDFLGEAQEHLKKEPWIVDFAKKRKADIGAAIAGDGRNMFIVAGGAGLLVAALAGVVIYTHRHQENKPKEEIIDKE